MSLLWPCLWLSASAAASPALPDYRDTLGQRLSAPLAQLNEGGHYRDAIKLAGRLGRAVGRMAAISYEAGYAHNQLGEFDVAMRHYDAALKRDPDMVAARYDRGELHLLRGDLDAASGDFLDVVRLKPAHWGGHFRLAHIAALTLDPVLFERHLMAAVRHGFDLEKVIGDPDWNDFVAHPDLRPVLRKLVVLYGNARLNEWVGERP